MEEGAFEDGDGIGGACWGDGGELESGWQGMDVDEVGE